MHKLRDGCEAAIPFAPDATDSQPAAARRELPQEAKTCRELPHQIPNCTNGGSHRYNIRTQRCYFCDRTYRDIVGREPEFMGKT